MRIPNELQKFPTVVLLFLASMLYNIMKHTLGLERERFPCVKEIEKFVVEHASLTFPYPTEEENCRKCARVKANFKPEQIMHQVSRIARMSSRAYTHDFQFLNAYRSATKFCNCSQLKFVVSSDDFVILMVGASRHHERGWNAANTWLKQIPYYYIFSDKSISSIRNYVTLPCLLNKSKRSDADHRQLWGLQWLYLRAPFLFEKKWFIFCDDDTWINVPFLKRYLSNFDENLPLSIGMIFDDLFVRRLAYHQGGAGVIVSNKAAKHLLTNLYGSCAHNFFNDVTLGTCFYKTGVLKISSDKLWWDPPFEPGENITSPFHSLTFVNKISYHHFSDYKVMREMTCLSAKFWNETVPSLC